MNMNTMLEAAVQQWPENLFLVREGITYSAFIEQVRARAATLMEHGIKPGDTVGVLSHNIPQFPYTVCNMVCWWTGADVGYKFNSVRIR